MVQGQGQTVISVQYFGLPDAKEWLSRRERKRDEKKDLEYEIEVET